MTGGPRPGCAKPYPSRGSLTPRDGAVLEPAAEPTVRGDTYEDSTVGIISITCRGVYRLSISVLGSHGTPYPPFGSASLTVR